MFIVKKFLKNRKQKIERLFSMNVSQMNVDMWEMCMWVFVGAS